MVNAVLDCPKLLKVELLHTDVKENTITSPSGDITLNEYGTSKKRDRAVLLKDKDNPASLVIKLTIQGTQIHTGNYTRRLEKNHVYRRLDKKRAKSF